MKISIKHVLTVLFASLNFFMMGILESSLYAILPKYVGALLSNKTSNISTDIQGNSTHNCYVESPHYVIVSLIFLSKNIGMLITNSLYGFLVEKFDIFLILVGTQLLGICVTLLYSFGNSILLIVIGRLVDSFVSAGLFVTVFAIISNYFSDFNVRGKYYGLCNIMFFMSISLGPLYGAEIDNKFGKFLVFILMIPMWVICIFCTIILYWYVEKRSKIATSCKLKKEKEIFISNSELNQETIHSFIEPFEPNNVSKTLSLQFLNINSEDPIELSLENDRGAFCDSKDNEKDQLDCKLSFSNSLPEMKKEQKSETPLPVVFNYDNNDYIQKDTFKKIEKKSTLKITCKILIDPYIFSCLVEIFIINISCFVLPTTLPSWMAFRLCSSEVEQGFIWTFGFIGYIVGVLLVILISKQIPKLKIFCPMIFKLIVGILLIGLPFTRDWRLLFIPIIGMYASVGVVEQIIFPMTTHLIDLRHDSNYGIMSALLGQSLSTCAVLSTLVSGPIAQRFGFRFLSISIGLINLISSPLSLIHHRKNFK